MGKFTSTIYVPAQKMSGDAFKKAVKETTTKKLKSVFLQLELNDVSENSVKFNLVGYAGFKANQKWHMVRFDIGDVSGTTEPIELPVAIGNSVLRKQQVAKLLNPPGKKKTLKEVRFTPSRYDGNAHVEYTVTAVYDDMLAETVSETANPCPPFPPD